eukprot:5894748-Lingulodinium_polyedra.AAC.1
MPVGVAQCSASLVASQVVQLLPEIAAGHCAAQRIVCSLASLPSCHLQLLSWCAFARVDRAVLATDSAP